MSDIEKIKSRVQKLLTLSRDRGATEDEAAVAMEKAMELLGSYNLTMAQCEGHHGRPADQPIVRQKFYDSSNSFWRRMLYNGTADLYMCSYYYTAGAYDDQHIRHATAHNLIGEEANILIAHNMALRFIEIGEQMATAYRGNGASFLDSFKKGFASRMTERLRERRAEAQGQTLQSASTGTSLVLADVYRKNSTKIAKWKAENNFRSGRSASISSSDQHGRAAGRQAADRVNVGASLSGGHTKALRG